MFEKINIFWLFFILIFLNFSAAQAVNTNFVSSPTIGTGASINFTPSGSINGANYIFGTSKLDSAGSSYFMGGNVGIGTTGANYKLEVNTARTNDGIFVTNGTSWLRYMAGTTGSGSYNGIVNAGDNAIIYSNGTNGSGSFVIAPWAGATSGIKMDGNGNVGIGTTTPGKLLDVNGQAIFRNFAYGTTPASTDILALSTVEYVNGKTGGSGGVGTGTSGQTLRHNGTGWIANSTLFNDGTNVGIGTTNPGTKLQIIDPSMNGTITSAPPSWIGLSIQRAYSSASGAALLIQGSTKALLATPASIYLGNADEYDSTTISGGSGTFKFFVRNGGAASGEVMRIQPNGSVGIGTTGPVTKLDVQAASGIHLGIRTGEADATAIQLNAYNDGGAANIPMELKASKFNFYNGNVGIGTTAPGAKLDVNGGIRGVTDAANNGGESFKTFVTYVNLGYTDDAVTNSIILLHPAYNGTLIAKYNFNGKILFSRGGTGAGNYSDEYDVQTSTAYNSNVGSIKAVTNSGVTADLVTADYGGVKYVALRIAKGSTRAVSFKGELLSTLSTPTLLLESAVTAIASINAPLIVMSSNGNVGIDTTTPGKLLEVNGQAKFNNFAYGTTPVSTDLLALSTVEYVNGKTGGSGGVGTGTSGQTLRHNGTGWVANSTLFNDGTNVGIGTTNPTYKLQVQQTSSSSPAMMISGGYYGYPRLQIYGLDTDSHAFMGFGTDMSGGPYELSMYTSNYSSMGKITFGTYDGATYNQKMVMLNDGKFGIGTTGPNDTLEVSKSTGGILRLSNPTEGALSGDIAGKINFYKGDTSYGAGIVSYIQSTSIDSGGTYNLDFATGDSGGGSNGINKKLTIQFNGGVAVGSYAGTNGAPSNGLIIPGNVGIGTTAPGTTVNSTNLLGGINSGDKFLDITGADGTPSVINLVNSLDTDGGTIGGLIFSRSGGAADAHKNLVGIIGVQDNSFGGAATTRGADLAFWTNAAGASTEAMRILGNGNVGIGTTNPTAKLMVSGAGVWTGAVISLVNTGPSGRRWDIFSTDTAFDQGAGKLLFYNNTSGSNAMIIDSSNNVGIGTTTPGKLLDVNGQAIFRNFAYGTTPVSTDLLALSTVEYVNGKTGGSGGVGTGTNGQTLRHNGTGWVANSTLFNDGTNVGIGTAAPFTKLTLPSTYSMGWEEAASVNPNPRRWWAGNDLIVYGDWGLGTATTKGAATPNLWRLYINNLGNVGIGTTNPGDKLGVSGGNITIDNSLSVGGVDGSGLKLFGDIGNKPYRSVDFVPFVPTGSAGVDYEGLKIYTANGTTNRVNALTILPGGNVGIGTASPVAPLSLFKSTANPAGKIIMLDIATVNSNAWWGTDKPTINFRTGYGGGTTIANLSSIYSYLQNSGTDVGGEMMFQTANALGTLTDRMVIDKSGNVGIGTTAPTVKLEVNGSVKLSEYNSVQSTYFADRAATGGYIETTPTDLKFITRNGNILFDTTAGNVGIGTIAPGKLLEVNGQGKFDSFAYGTTPAGTDTLALTTVEYVNGILAGGIVYHRTNVTTSPYIALATDYIIAYNGPNGGTITLPVALCNSGTVGVGRAYEITNESTFTVTVTTGDPTVSKISGNTQQALAPYNSIPVYCNGTSWFIY